MASLPRIGLYLITIVLILIAVSVRMIMEVERFSDIARASTMVIFGICSLTSFFTARGLAKKRRWSWWSGIFFYSVSVLLFSFFHFKSIANTPTHPAHQGYSQGAVGMPIFFVYFHAIFAGISVIMLLILVAFRRHYSKT